ncbi:MAG TPA: GAF domain-containing SpoIIE family protein phosphatase [Kineosporiaceae bacterium]|nr:GAF domain-containing SpoIIE family protein phosphatase [Kineosporiaceae bacterium]
MGPYGQGGGPAQEFPGYGPPGAEAPGVEGLEAGGPGGEGPESGEVGALLGRMRPGWDVCPAAVVVTAGPRHRVVYRNAAAEELFGFAPRPAGTAGAFPAAVVADLDRVWVSGVVRVRRRRQVGLRDPDRPHLHVSYSVARVEGPDGRPYGLVLSAVDLSAEVRAELAANRAGLLARLSERMNGATGPAAALQALTDTLVPELADVAGVYVLPEVGEADPVGLPARPGFPVALSVAPALDDLGPLPPLTPVPLPPPDWRRGGRVAPVVLDLSAGLGPDGDPQTRSWLAYAAARNLVALPLSVAGRPIGLLVLIAAGRRPPYGEGILPFLTDIAARAGVAVVQVRTRQAQARISHRLQQSLLPAAPPLMPGVHIAAGYLPGGEDVEVGGDWWEATRLDAAHLALGVGDASGRGIEAAIVMGQARAAILTASLAGLSPSEVLRLVDRQLHDVIADSGRRRPDGPQFVTALHAVVDVATGRAVVANAGHLPLLLLPPDAPVARTVHVPPGPPLGLGLGGYTETVLEIPRGGSLLLFTDGLVEDRNRDFATGLALLGAELAAQAAEQVDRALLRILAALGVTARRRPGDDVAAVLLRREVHRRH